MKRTIRLTESELKRIISESVRRIMNEEFDWEDIRSPKKPNKGHKFPFDDDEDDEDPLDKFCY